MASQTASVDSDAQSIYHVRLIEQWTQRPANAPDSSFYGLQLELHGLLETLHTPVTILVDVSADAHNNPPLKSIVSPFQLVVRSKLQPDTTILSQQQTLVLQRLAAVQQGNSLLEINNVRFLRSSATASDVIAQLRRVVLRASLGRPFTLTFQRQNHAKAAAKIVPFAARADVQAAQLAQFDRLQEQENTLSDIVKRKKQFILQQLDFELEHYLYDHIGMQLHTLHEQIMARGVWQAYEFEQALWYFHAPTQSLFAEHPMRNDARTRQLIGSALLRTRFSVIKLQRGTRAFLRRVALADQVVNDPRLLEAMWTLTWNSVWEPLWQHEFLPLATSKTTSRTRSVDAEVDLLWAAWKEARRRRKANRTSAFSVLKTTASTATSPRPLPVSDASINTDEVATIAVAAPVRSPRKAVVDSSTQSDTPRPVILCCDAGVQVEIPPAGREEAQVDLKVLSVDAATATTPNESKGSRMGEQVAEWKGQLQLLKTNLIRRKQRHSPVHRSTQTELPPQKVANAQTQRKRSSLTRGVDERPVGENARQTRSQQANLQRVDSFSEYCRSLAFTQGSFEVDVNDDSYHAEDLSWRRRARQSPEQPSPFPGDEYFLPPGRASPSPMVSCNPSLAHFFPQLTTFWIVERLQEFTSSRNAA